MAGTIFVLTHTDPLESGGTASPTRGGKVLLRRFINFLMGCISGTKRVTGFQIFADGATPVAASATATCAAVEAADTVTINGVAMTATQHHARGTLTLASAAAGDNAIVGGVTFVGTNGAVTLGAATYDVRTSDTAAAASLAAQINAYVALQSTVTATSALGVVTIRAVSAGTGGNSIALDEVGTTITRSAATLENGAAVGANQFDFGGTNTQTATALALAINSSTSTLVSKFVTATSSAGVVTVTACHQGALGNAYTFVSSNGTRLAVTGSGRLASGAGGVVTGQTVTL